MELARVSSGEGEWEVDSVPSVVVGTEASGMLFSRPSWAVRFSDGRIAVADGGTSSRVSLFSPQGVFEEEVGRTGQGPGEFQWVTHMTRGPEDSLYVYDRSLQRLTAFSRSRDPARIAHFLPPSDGSARGGLNRVFRLENDVWAGQGMESMVAAPPGTLAQDTVAVGLMDADLTEYSRLALVPGLMTTTTVHVGGARPMIPAFTPQALTATWGRCVFVTYTGSPKISVYASDGSLVTTFDGPGTRRPVTRRLLDERLEAHLERFPDADPRWYESLFKETAHTTHLPFYSSMLLDQRGHLWLQEYSPPYGFGTRWSVLTQAGDFMAHVGVPHDLMVYSISEAGVLGRRRTESGVEVVEVLPLSRSPSEPPPTLSECAASSETAES
jgi:hypothetical protein